MKKMFYLPVFLILLIGCKNKENTSSQEAYKRTIQLAGQNNFRDLGNYSNEKGGVIRKHLIYRSGTLSKITDQDKAIIKELGIKTVINFLTKEEIAKRGSDNLPVNVKSVYLPISGDNDEASTVLNARQTGDFSKVPVELNYNIHKILPEVGKDSYYQFLKLLADSTIYPVLFHCSHGVHRTGTAAALLLSLLEVPWSQIETDYLLSNECRKHESEMRIEQLDSMARQGYDNLDFDKNREYIEAFYLLESDYILGTKRHIEETYGSFDKYFEYLGLTKKEISKVKKNLINEQ
ncbi:tyrosine-protein phosphatase [Cognatitamlana onchidii]|uniref:tyrosine-protein phosphatase n=1 Tax=Cognatitamlana onchidii TaxID=2562860 RepID=UPI0010A5C58F|nr:tyrosine-protein phosphatase [Algibacter onchidii]